MSSVTQPCEHIGRGTVGDRTSPGTRPLFSCSPIRWGYLILAAGCRVKEGHHWSLHRTVPESVGVQAYSVASDRELTARIRVDSLRLGLVPAHQVAQPRGTTRDWAGSYLTATYPRPLNPTLTCMTVSCLLVADPISTRINQKPRSCVAPMGGE